MGMKREAPLFLGISTIEALLIRLVERYLKLARKVG